MFRWYQGHPEREDSAPRRDEVDEPFFEQRIEFAHACGFAVFFRSHVSSFAQRVMESVDRRAAAAKSSTASESALKTFAQGGKLTVLMICMGNICRSPTAEAVLRSKLEQAGLADCVVVDSAGTHAWHRGEAPDSRSIAHAHKRGYDLSSLRSRPITHMDFETCDLILAMDWDNLELLEEQCPAPHRTKIGRLSQYAKRFADPVVPDPYAGGAAGFDHVLNLVEDACDGFIDFLLQKRNEASRGTS